MGDVCGKGPDAAAVTALARYTLRAAAMRERLPSRSLGLLNEALLRQRDDRRFCTVAYAYLEPLDRGRARRRGQRRASAPAAAARGRHRRGGRGPGTLLGVVPTRPRGPVAGTLEPGDALVFYTDGVIEAVAIQRQFPGRATGSRLVATCAGAGRRRHRRPGGGGRLQSQDGNPRDDIAVLVLRVAA